MTTTSTSPHAHPLARAFGIDTALVLFSLGAVVLSFGTGQGVPNWHNIVFPPLVMLLAGVALLLAVAEIRLFRRTASQTEHRLSTLLEVVVALCAIVVVGPMLVIMPFVFLGALL
jgi:hypothetical protein